MQLKLSRLDFFLSFLLVLTSFSRSFLFSMTDLEEKTQDFIVETKRIEIPGYPDAFNPSIVRWGGSLLMSFRIRDPVTAATNQIGLIWLNDKLNPVGHPYILNKQLKGYSTDEEQDPRFIALDDRLYMIYSNTQEKGNKETRRVFIGQVHFDGVGFFLKSAECLNRFEKGEWVVQEKNWAPFIYQGKLYLSYSLVPHRVFRPLLNGTNKCDNCACTKGAINWKWGELRGGTTGLMANGQYLAFFHSSKDMMTVQSGGQRIIHYFMGAYTFSSEPPFEITGISPEPIIGKNFYNGPAYKTWKPLRVVFPCGFVQNDRFVWVAYGKQDHEAWIVKIDKQKLLNSLVPVSTIQ